MEIQIDSYFLNDYNFMILWLSYFHTIFKHEEIGLFVLPFNHLNMN